jgi:hypothetical protein
MSSQGNIPLAQAAIVSRIIDSSFGPMLTSSKQHHSPNGLMPYDELFWSYTQTCSQLTQTCSQLQIYKAAYDNERNISKQQKTIIAILKSRLAENHEILLRSTTENGETYRTMNDEFSELASRLGLEVVRREKLEKHNADLQHQLAQRGAGSPRAGDSLKGDATE